MNRARVIAAPLSLTLGLVFGCSSPPSPPPQAAASVLVKHTGSYNCDAGGNITNEPDNPGTYTSLQSCNLTSGCHPDQYVVVDGDQGAQVQCSVQSTSSSEYAIQLSLTSAQMALAIQGGITTTGGAVSLSETDTANPTLQKDPACAITIKPNVSVLKPGAIWADFDCLNFKDPNTGDPNARCEATGSFLFENCSK